ncbi:cystatin-like fold lipoprotein [Salicibibacter cibi]|uniref:Cystatin-like fold lipoprotein n=1 Tax=Salicibibacter cibi TaxID=2743001 RepID=A0A7T7CFK1_9BACI|nr:cystatin-like fold lipoprotein [Salicibibacter cibi]QQK80163.1 cystatin-like fold lipoprotein [Salicibibacter cibi]
MDVIAYYHEENANTDEDIEIRENADIKVWEDGRYISAVFYDEEGNEEGDFIIEELRGEFTDLRGDLDAARQSPDPDYQERFGEEID